MRNLMGPDIAFIDKYIPDFIPRKFLPRKSVFKMTACNLACGNEYLTELKPPRGGSLMFLILLEYQYGIKFGSW